MFKNHSAEDELFRSMEKALLAKRAEKKAYELNKWAQAVDYLNNAATILEQAGMVEEADAITAVLTGLAKDLQ